VDRDVVIIGAGPAGLSFARALAGTGLDVLVVERLDRCVLEVPPVDGRDIALTHHSVSILKSLGAWRHFPAEAVSRIREARVLDGDSPYFLQFDHRGICDDALGYLVPNHHIRKAVFEAVSESGNVELMTGVTPAQVGTDAHKASVELADGRTIDCRLLVAADSRFSATRRQMGISADMHDFGRVVIVCRMQGERSHDDIAWECFRYGDTLAVLPLHGNDVSVVITVPATEADRVVDMPEEEFNRRIEKQSGGRFGAMRLLGGRHPYPLVAVHANRFIGTRFALMGDAAVGMHPVTAHGFNLGLRGADSLAREIRVALARSRDIGGAPVLNRYEARHRRITRPLYHGTNAIVRLYTNDRPVPRIVRRAVLRIGNRVGPIKRIMLDRLTEAG